MMLPAFSLRLLHSLGQHRKSREIWREAETFINILRQSPAQKAGVFLKKRCKVLSYIPKEECRGAAPTPFWCNLGPTLTFHQLDVVL